MDPKDSKSIWLPTPRPDDPSAEIRALAARQLRSAGPLMALVQKMGGKLEDQLAHLPKGARARIEAVTEAALRRALSLAAHGRHAPDLGAGGAPALAAVSGAAGGAGGLATALVELPVTVTLILHAILRAAEAEGFDTTLPEVQAEALRVLTSGGPLAEDDGINTSFLGARLTVTGPALHKLLAKIAPKFAAVLSQKLAAQAVPVLGALSGAALNTAFLTHYRELAHIRFALLRLASLHGAERVRDEFGTELARLRLRHG
ncbi:EcsC family protein [Szabonella alba]|uniref:EcsC family protein n=1 Tax=Szabonella alba TaxID=2804194 RepID=A0A8K0Y025_9RHOB|nr:EcsC family protein [Szabonella alba]MBL4917745.1 EcsC family protein [Szabonella alba]